MSRGWCAVNGEGIILYVPLYSAKTSLMDSPVCWRGTGSGKVEERGREATNRLKLGWILLDALFACCLADAVTARNRRERLT